MKIQLGKLEFEAKEFPLRLYNKDGKEIYYCDLEGNESWHEYDEDGDLIYCHHSKSKNRGTPRSKSLEGKVVEIDDAFTYTWNESKYTKTEEEDGTIILKPKTRKIWIEVFEYADEIKATAHTTKDSLDKNVKFGQENEETLLEIIEREYPINNK